MFTKRSEEETEGQFGNDLEEDVSNATGASVDHASESFRSNNTAQPTTKKRGFSKRTPDVTEGETGDPFEIGAPVPGRKEEASNDTKSDDNHSEIEQDPSSPMNTTSSPQTSKQDASESDLSAIEDDIIEIAEAAFAEEDNAAAIDESGSAGISGTASNNHGNTGNEAVHARTKAAAVAVTHSFFAQDSISVHSIGEPAPAAVSREAVGSSKPESRERTGRFVRVVQSAAPWAAAAAIAVAAGLSLVSKYDISQSGDLLASMGNSVESHMDTMSDFGGRHIFDSAVKMMKIDQSSKALNTPASGNVATPGMKPDHRETMSSQMSDLVQDEVAQELGSKDAELLIKAHERSHTKCFGRWQSSSCTVRTSVEGSDYELFSDLKNDVHALYQGSRILITERGDTLRRVSRTVEEDTVSLENQDWADVGVVYEYPNDRADNEFK